MSPSCTRRKFPASPRRLKTRMIIWMDPSRRGMDQIGNRAGMRAVQKYMGGAIFFARIMQSLHAGGTSGRHWRAANIWYNSQSYDRHLPLSEAYDLQRVRTSPPIMLWAFKIPSGCIIRIRLKTVPMLKAVMSLNASIIDKKCTGRTSLLNRYNARLHRYKFYVPPLQINLLKIFWNRKLEGWIRTSRTTWGNIGKLKDCISEETPETSRRIEQDPGKGLGAKG